MNDLQMKTLKCANIGLALKNTVAVVHDIFDLCILSFLVDPLSSYLNELCQHLSNRWSSEQCIPLT